ncbi:MAG: 16S rRNA (cytidine(1402)-2'-O)-methyltransferase [Actinomycetaceae bacterium]|nr:16S rRNA (cytidine(1402)-2'-O)-methyltransferase [Actinomycetaceae bacterium]
MDYPNAQALDSVIESPFSKASILLAATPIGNTGDASERLRAALAHADIIAAEDTRRAHDLVRRLGLDDVVQAEFLSFFEHNEDARIPKLLDAARAGRKVVVISDAGMPGVSDPGMRLVQAAQASGMGGQVSVLPGPSAVLTALALSGLATDRFTFEGFLPRKSGDIRSTLDALRFEQRTMVFFESPRRTMATLEHMVQSFGPDRQASLCRELTKTHEEVLSGTLGFISETLRTRQELLGEIALVISGYISEGGDVEDAVLLPLLEELEQLVQLGVRPKDGAKHIAARQATTLVTPIKANQLYEAYLQRAN